MNRMCVRGLRRLLLHTILLNLFVSALTKNEFDSNPANGVEETRVVKVDGGPPGVVWVVQVSDIHISRLVPERGRALRRALGHALQLIKPAIVLISGDLTDAKIEKSASGQDEGEWVEYRDSMAKVADDSGIPLERFYDLRGNHDKYGVPPSSTLNYFSKYSISAAFNRNRLVQSATVEGGDSQKHLFVGFDDSMTVGLRGPSNAFGHPTDELLQQLDLELRRGGNATTKIVYGHYTMSFTTSTETGKRPEEVMANNNVVAYLCGHLHTKFGRRLYKRHNIGDKGFWEWEVGDWRTSRVLRVLAIDNGHTSFVDVELLPPTDKSQAAFSMPTFILQTYPLDSRFMLQSGENTKVVSDSIRALVFAETIPVTVTVRIYDFTVNPPKLVNESSMELHKGDEPSTGAYYYTAPWESARYHHTGAGFKYAMQIDVEDIRGNICHSEMRFFSVEGEVGEFHLTASAFLVFGFRWEQVFPIYLWGMISFLVAILLIPKLFLYHLQRRGQYEKWLISLFDPASSPREALAKIIKVPFWVMLEGARNSSIWVGMFTYVVFLILFPWFWGRILPDGYPLGYMSVRGWTLKPSKADSEQTLSGLGVPDIMGIVLPYLYGVVLPLLLLLSALSAEKAACEFHITSLGKRQKKTEREPEGIASKTSFDPSLFKGGVAGLTKGGVQAHEQLEAPVSSEMRVNKHDNCHLCERLVRKGLVLGCLGVAYNHWRLCSTVLGAYGPVVLAGPAYALGVPALLMLTFFQTSRLMSKSPWHEL
ncbi:putative metallophosphoesterase At3g03305 [Physcomitrium patens]|uniref:Uncharacterized protein n=1 Tax=Physcomitrium patens TaxID=3218 RepID=A0A2K1IK74_PHYPA|nr:putative metallophosphoesterase At3g03305 [Physcomitrium patens]PNR29677.1 hypothetical protein PHYPA_028371 [Physcomitrium patens]|eukprot:XP_024361562.1 putative metallophosphoesterase At3g03305 [Physcomitrella patens]